MLDRFYASSASLGASLAALLALACAKQENPGDDEIGETTDSGTETGPSETDTDTDTSESTSDEGNFIPSDESDTGETSEPEPKTCREMLDCVFMCLGELGLECLQTCGEGFDPAEAQKAGDLVLCLGQVCVEKEQCSLTDFAAEECIGCIGLGLFLPEPPGCEAEAMACQ
jgi:hypothetical protein